jgi:hypothetical protein
MKMTMMMMMNGLLIHSLLLCAGYYTFSISNLAVWTRLVLLSSLVRIKNGLWGLVDEKKEQTAIKGGPDGSKGSRGVV